VILILTLTAALTLARFDAIRADIPGQPVHIAIDVPDLGRDAQSLDPERILLSGKTESGCIVSILYEENFPFVASKEVARRFAAGKRVQSFTVGEISCCEFKTEIRDTIVETTYHAWPTTSDYRFDVHVSYVVPKRDVGKIGAFSRSDFVKVLGSFRAEGRPDRAELRLPEEIYGYRDEAAAAGADAFNWAVTQCILRSTDWAPHFYLGVLAMEMEKPDKALEGLARASELLETLDDRSPKHTHALLVALDRAAGIHAGEKRFDKVIPFCDRMVAATKVDDPPETRRFREEALFLLAGCQARLAQKDKAIAALKLAIEARPDFRSRAASSELFEPLRGLPEFQRLVGN
jgi:hypothetical protein